MKKAVYEDVIGHATVRALLEKAVTFDAHSVWLLTGPEHVGKTALATSIIADLLQVSPAQVWIHPGLWHLGRSLDEETGVLRESIGMDDVEKARSFLEHTALSGSRKVLLITEADCMTVQAANALLKTLEEPRGDVRIFLTAADPSRLLTTVTSRTVTVRLRPVASAVLSDALYARGADRALADRLARASRGLPGVALAWLSDPEKLAEYEADVERTRACLSVRAAERILAARALVPTIKEHQSESRRELLARLEVLEGTLRDALLTRAGCSDLAVTPERSGLSIVQLGRACKTMATTRADIRQYIHPRITLLSSMLSF